ncbi:MAG: DUF6807 family protein [Planctomycetota bacterium]
MSPRLIRALFSLAVAAGSCPATEQQPSPATAGHEPAAAATAKQDLVLRRDGKVAARLVARDWDPAKPRATCKLYHHIYAPDGRLLTKGEGGQFEHHRGLFVGWNQTKWTRASGAHRQEEGLQADFWHMRDGARQSLVGHRPPAQLGLGDGGQHAEILWHVDSPTGDKRAVTEHRGLEVVEESADHHVLRMIVRLAPAEPDTKVVLQGDPQHAGQQFRALQQFAEKGAEPARYLRSDGATDKGNDVWLQCTWIAAILPLADGAVTVLRIETPPKSKMPPPTWSTRPYGRFGATRKLTLPTHTEDERKAGGKIAATTLEYFYVIALGEQTAAWCQAHATRLRDRTKATPSAAEKR